MEKLKLLELFGGIGACSKALERLGIDYEIVDYVEIDKYAVKSYNAIHNTSFDPQDICNWNKQLDIDLIMHGSPCQDFSVIGKNAGGDKNSGTRSSLMYETLRIVENLKPKYVVWENVKNLISKKHKHNFDNYINQMDLLGYNSYYQVLNAKDYGIPQNRERIFTISILKQIDKGYKFPSKQELKLKLKDMIENEVDEKYYLKSEKLPLYDIELINTMPDGTCRTIKNQYYKTSQANFQRTSTFGATGVLKIKCNTKKGYLEAYEGDGIYTNVSNKRGTVQKQMIPALTSVQDKGVVLNERT